DRRAPGGVLAHEVRDHVLLELALEVDDVVGDADLPRDAARVVKTVERAAAAEPDLSLLLVVELHRQTDNLVPVSGEQARGDRRIHSAAHGDYDPHLTPLRVSIPNHAIPNSQSTTSIQLPKLPSHENRDDPLGVGPWQLIGSWAVCSCGVDSEASLTVAPGNGALRRLRGASSPTRRLPSRCFPPQG